VKVTHPSRLSSNTRSPLWARTISLARLNPRPTPSMSRLRDLSVILCTGYSLDTVTQRLLEKGVNDFIQKPFDPNSLALKVRKILDGQ